MLKKRFRWMQGSFDCARRFARKSSRSAQDDNLGGKLTTNS